jgi:hypothetical protein
MANVIGRHAYSNQSGRIIRNVRPAVTLIDDNIQDAALLAFLNLVDKETTGQEEFTWDVDNFLATSDTTDATATASATTLSVSNADRFNVGQLWVNKRTGEIFLVSATNVGAGSITVQRAVTALNSSGGTAAAAMVSGDTLIMLAPAVGENSTRQVFQSRNPVPVSNYTQQFRWDISFSERQLKRRFDTGSEWDRQSMKQLKEAQMGLNRTLLAGEKARFTQDGDSITTTQGMLNVPTTNTYSVGGTLFEYDFDEFLVEQGMLRGSNSKVLLASNAVILAISQMTKDKITYQTANFSAGKIEVGHEIMKYHSPTGGSLIIMEDRHLSTNYNGTALGLDLDQLKIRTFDGAGREGDLHITENTQDVDDLGMNNTLSGDLGLEYGAEELHFKLENVDGGAARRAVA